MITVKAIEVDDEMQREYIPLAGGYEWQTKGKGSTARLLMPDGETRHPLSEPPHILKALDEMFRAQHSALLFHNGITLLEEVLNSDMAQREEDEGNVSPLLQNIRKYLGRE